MRMIYTCYSKKMMTTHESQTNKDKDKNKNKNKYKNLILKQKQI